MYTPRIAGETCTLIPRTPSGTSDCEPLTERPNLIQIHIFHIKSKCCIDTQCRCFRSWENCHPPIWCPIRFFFFSQHWRHLVGCRDLLSFLHFKKQEKRSGKMFSSFLLHNFDSLCYSNWKLASILTFGDQFGGHLNGRPEDGIPHLKCHVYFYRGLKVSKKCCLCVWYLFTIDTFWGKPGSL